MKAVKKLSYLTSDEKDKGGGASLINSYISKHGKRLYGLCLTLTKNREAADDLYQETWLKVCSRFEKYNREMPFEPWLTKICVNTYRDMLRRMKKNLFTDDFSAIKEKDIALEKVSEIEKEDYSPLYLAIDRLPEKLRLTVVLFYFNGLDEKETAQTLGIPPGTVKSRLNKARKLLRKELEDERTAF